MELHMRFIHRLLSNFFIGALLVFTAGLISVYDNVMNVIFFDSLPMDERNPFASWLISRVGVAGLVEIKAITTILAVFTMLCLLKTKYRIVILPVCLFQLGLFYYLTFHVASGSLLSKDFGIPLKLFYEFYQGNYIP
tara:strand:- start:66 stop:476 length:411 start_codon:yes stop_codon:yes gene_type:complete